MKQHETLRRVPVVVLTSSRENADVARAYGLGANSYFVKPASQEALLRTVEQIDAYWIGINEPAGTLRTK